MPIISECTRQVFTRLEDIEVVERIPVLISSCEYNSEYLRVKKEELGHLL